MWHNCLLNVPIRKISFPFIQQVQLYDQIVFESVKSPGHYFHASEPHQLDYKSYGYVPFKGHLKLFKHFQPLSLDYVLYEIVYLNYK